MLQVSVKCICMHACVHECRCMCEYIDTCMHMYMEVRDLRHPSQGTLTVLCFFFRQFFIGLKPTK